MKLFGSLSELVSVIWRKNGFLITARPNQATTYTAARDIQQPPGDADHVLMSANSTQTVTNKSIAATQITGQLATANGGTGQNSTATFPTSGVVVTEAGTETLSNKTLDNSTTAAIKDANFTIQDDADTTKQAKFQASGITTGTTRTYTLPDASTTVVGTDATQTLTNKSIVASQLTGQVAVSNGGTGQATANAGLNALLPSQTGNNTKFLQTDGTNTSWQSSSSSTASPTALGVVSSYFPTIQSAVLTTTNAGATMGTTDGYETYLFSTGNTNRTFTLAAAASNTGRRVQIKKTDSGTGYVIVDPNSAELIDGASTRNLIFQYESMIIECDGTGWHIVAYFEKRTSSAVTISFGAGWGTVVTQDIKVTRKGKWAHFHGYFVTPTTSAADGRMTLPSGYAIDFTDMTTATNLNLVGRYVNHQAGTSTVITIGGALYSDGSNSDRILFGYNSGGGAPGTFLNAQPNEFSGNNRNINIDFMIPITDWA